jgi:hypothetical protein
MSVAELLSAARWARLGTGKKCGWTAARAGFSYITVDWCDAARILLPIKRGAEAKALLGVRYIQARPG